MNEIKEYTGVIEQCFLDIGSKSERNTLCLMTDDACCHPLIRHGGHAFHDPHLALLVGRRVKCCGWIDGQYLFFTEIGENG